MSTSSHPVGLPLSKGLAAGIATVATLGLLSGGFTLGVLATHGFSAPSATAGTTPTTTPTATTGTPTTASGPFVTGATVNWHTPLETLAGQPTTLARGSKGTIIMAMASWCLYCGYEDKWVLPVLAKTPGVVVDIVDVSPQGGIADPGPQSPAFSGHDGTGGALTVAGMASTMQRYVKAFGTLSASNIHVYVAPTATQTAWNIQSFPSLAFVGANGTVAVAPGGAQTLSQAQTDVQQALGS